MKHNPYLPNTELNDLMKRKHKLILEANSQKANKRNFKKELWVQIHELNNKILTLAYFTFVNAHQ